MVEEGDGVPKDEQREGERFEPRRLLVVLLALGLLATLLYLTGAMASAWGWLRDSGRQISERYNLDITATIIAFALAEAVYVATVAGLLVEAGKGSGWSEISRFRIRDIKLDTPRLMAWWWANRAVWAAFWGAIIAITWGRVPWWATGAAAVDIAVNLAWGVVIAFGIRLPGRSRAKS